MTPQQVRIINKQEALDVISRELLVEQGVDLNLLNKYLYARSAALVIEYGGTVAKAKSIGLVHSEQAMGANTVVSRMARPEGVNFNAYDRFMEVLFNLKDDSDTTVLKEIIRDIQLQNLVRIVQKTRQVLDVVGMGANLTDATNFVKDKLK